MKPETLAALEAALHDQEPEYDAWTDERLQRALRRVRKQAREARQQRRREEETG